MYSQLNDTRGDHCHIGIKFQIIIENRHNDSYVMTYITQAGFSPQLVDFHTEWK